MWRTKYCRSVWAERVLNAFQCISEQGLLRVRATCCILAAIAVLPFLPENASPLLRWVFHIRIPLAGKSCSTPAGWLLTLRKFSPIMTLQFSYYAHWILDGRPNVSSWLHCLAAKLKMASNRIAETVHLHWTSLTLTELSLLRDITTVRWSHNIFSKPGSGCSGCNQLIPQLWGPHIRTTSANASSHFLDSTNAPKPWDAQEELVSFLEAVAMPCHVCDTMAFQKRPKTPHPSHILRGSLSCWWIGQQDWRMHCCMY